ncbi:hypothetical protein [Flavobacterium piscis]|uniref:Uncharacterized protein n=1 Tax=Flavobacterium piscis TaxID=1114874 RepID=A0ABU1Y2G4_9FLAO|nr:hypothetical protein [Flavobacterium piscis]MDR7208409.1 hypothetical protein [Flavobacterium piscis]
MLEKLGYGWIDPETCIERDNTHTEEENERDDEELYDYEDDNDDRIVEVKLYDLSLTHDENFEDEETMKHILLPINRDGFMGNSFTPLTNAGSKIVMDSKKFVANSENIMDFMVLDYDTMFGLRLLTFQRYNSTFFSCDERIFFETLLIKFHSYGFKSFYISYPTVQKELGIKKDRLITISKKFHNLGIATTEIKKSFINGRASQITYYNIDAYRIIELLPNIYNNKYLPQITNEMEEYLRPVLSRKINTGVDEIVRSTW